MANANENISGYGLVLTVRASNTFPLGFTITNFADDADPLDIPSIKIADTARELNGTLLTWSTPPIIQPKISVIAGSLEDINLSILLQANTVGSGKIGARDEITMIGVYPNFRTVTLTNGVLTDGMPGMSISSAGRFKSKEYIFSFSGIFIT